MQSDRVLSIRGCGAAVLALSTCVVASAQSTEVFVPVTDAMLESPDDEDYLVDHSSFVYLMGRDGSFLTMFRGATDSNGRFEIGIWSDLIVRAIDDRSEIQKNADD